MEFNRPSRDFLHISQLGLIIYYTGPRYLEIWGVLQNFIDHLNHLYNAVCSAIGITLAHITTINKLYKDIKHLIDTQIKYSLVGI